MKNFLLLLALLITYNGIAQNLETKIPSNAQIVVGVNGDKLLELMPLDELNNLSFIKKIIDKENINNLEDLGFDLNQEAYYFNQLIDKRFYNSFIIYLSDSKKFENSIEIQKYNNIETINGYNFLIENKIAVSWNNNMLIITSVKGSDILYEDANDINNDVFMFEEIIEEEVVEGVEIVEEEVVEEKLTEEVFEFEEFVKEVETEKDIAEDTEKAVEEEITEEEITEFMDKIDASQNSDKSKNNKTKYYNKQLLKEQILLIIATNPKNSIAINKSFKSGKKSKSSVYFWIKDYNNFITSIIHKLEFSKAYSKMMPIKDFAGFKSVNSNLFFEKDEIKIIGEFYVNDKMKDFSKKIYSSKLKRNFYKYFNQDDMLAYIGHSTNMQAVLEEYPKIIKLIYNTAMPKYSEEISVFADIISVMLDEKAIAEVITGDALFILNDITEQEVSYISYEYDNDYNRSKVTKTKKEVLPIFTIMIGSENKDLIDKLLHLGIKHKIAKEKNFGFKIAKEKSKSPFDLYFVIQDGIAFITNSETQINKISQKKVSKSLGKHKRILKKNLLSFYMNSEKIIERLPSNEFGTKNDKLFAISKNNFKEMQFTYSRLKHGKFNAEQIIKTTSNNENSLKAIFNFIEQLSHLK